MRYLILTVLLVLSIQCLMAQPVPSDCETQDSIKFWYDKEAARLSSVQLDRQGSAYSDSVVFPDSLREKKLRALIAVYNVQGIPEADTVAHIRPIFDFRSYFFEQFYVSAEPHLVWMQNLKNKQLPCGHPVLDSVLTRYNINKYEYDSHTVFGRDHVTFTTPVLLNTRALTKILDQQPDMESFPKTAIGGGTMIQDSVFTDHIELTYSYGWGDCFSGCIYRRYWKFKVYDDCAVEFTESYGNTLPPLGIPQPVEKEAWTVFPNPFTHTLDIGNMYEPCEYALYSADGRLLKEGALIGSRITDLNFLPIGLYILHLRSQDSSQVFRISKE